MKLTVALLADHAVAQDDGKVYILGGGLDHQVSDHYPTQVSLAVVAKVAFGLEESGREYKLVLSVLSPTGSEVRPSLVLPLRPVLRPELPGDEISFPFVQNIKDLELDEPGTYSFVFKVEDAEDELARLDFRALKGPSLRSPAADALSQSLNAGFQAFDAGHVDAALTIFRRAVTEFPNSAEAHNNLGFTLLAARQPEESLAAFDQAGRLGYRQPELLHANRACCRYLSGDYEGALVDFEQLMKLRLMSSSAILFVLNADDLSPVWLVSAGDLVGLAALNAGWAALNGGHAARVHEFAAIASAGRITFTDHNGSREVFATALDALIAASSDGSGRGPSVVVPTPTTPSTVPPGVRES